MSSSNLNNVANSVDKLIDEIVTYISLSDHHRLIKSKSYNWQQPSLNYFNQAEPWLQSYTDHNHRNLLDKLTADTHAERVFFRPSEIHPKDFPKVDITILSDHSSKDSPELDEQGCKFGFIRVRTVPLKELRGRIKMISPYFIELSGANVFEKGIFTSSRVYCAWLNNKWTTFAAPEMIIPEHRVTDKSDQISMLMSISLTARYEWHVSLGYNRSYMIKFPTNPIGAKEVFKLRDIPEGKQRRTALRGWVNEHWRTRINDPEEEIKIREHLRGNEKFNWNGLYCEISPSDYDIAKLNKIKLEPKAIRKKQSK